MSSPEGTFEINKPLLEEVLKQIHIGAIQLPDFQRGWVWDNEHIRSLIASISKSFPIGAMMMLKTGGNRVRFKPQPIKGVELDNPPYPDKFILDGQQRLTSLYLSIWRSKPVPTTTEKKKKIDRFYYLAMEKCLDPEVDRFDAVVSLPPDKMIKSDFGRKIELDVSTREKEYEHGLFPLALVFYDVEFSEWKMGFHNYFKHDPEKYRFLSRFEHDVWLRFQRYPLLLIELNKDTPKEAVCQVFEKVNTGGVTLSVFELVTATFAADDYQLRKDWEKRKEKLDEHKVLEKVDESSFLTAVTLLSSYFNVQEGKTKAISCKRKDVLALSLDDYKKNADKIEEGFKKAARFLVNEKVYDDRSLPYSTQLIPLSAMCAVLDSRFDQDPVRRKLARWYWCGVFGELYGGANETRFAFDLPEVIDWIDDGKEPRSIRDASFSPTRLLTLKSRLSAAYKGLMAQLMQVGSQDFLSGDPIEVTRYFDLNIDIHHIFPKDYCTKNNLPEDKWNCIVNKAAISSSTNRIIGGNAPGDYLANLEKKHDVESERLDTILESHKINPQFLRNDDFDRFFVNRASNLLDLIEGAMGKSIQGRDSEEVEVRFGASLKRKEND